jgi:hypothetical protein
MMIRFMSSIKLKPRTPWLSVKNCLKRPKMKKRNRINDNNEPYEIPD